MTVRRTRWPTVILVLTLLPGTLEAQSGEERPAPTGPLSAPAAVPANGDIDGSGGTDLTDVLKLVTWLFYDGLPPVATSCDVADGSAAGEQSAALVPDGENGDLDRRGRVDITDVLRLVGYLYFDGAAPTPISCVEVAPRDAG